MSVHDDLELGRAMCAAWGLDASIVRSIRVVLEPGSPAVAHVVLGISEEAREILLELAPSSSSPSV